ncbi:transposase [Xanthomonas oryzae pv. oryzae PXO99A]|uniref:Transposase n=1 Tax=Xanthomonas oryzae pv. oryzae (strain PXO99A) TaxID=360094 RepID=A0A0K0GFH8_XANOP|nr:transposase [Xanthomonas oryzae pv. oryzae PXO99A]
MLQIIVPLCHYGKTFRPRGRAVLNRTLEVRFEQYEEVVAAALSHRIANSPHTGT